AHPPPKGQFPLIPPPLVGGGWGRGPSAPARQRLPRRTSPTYRLSHTRLPAQAPSPFPPPTKGRGNKNRGHHPSAEAIGTPRPRCAVPPCCTSVTHVPGLNSHPPAPCGRGLGAGSARGSAQRIPRGSSPTERRSHPRPTSRFRALSKSGGHSAMIGPAVGEP